MNGLFDVVGRKDAIDKDALCALRPSNCLFEQFLIELIQRLLLRLNEQTFIAGLVVKVDLIFLLHELSSDLV